MAANTAPTALAEQFATPEQQRESAFLGMWTFLATEIMLFGGLFFGIVVYRVLYPDAAREASQHLYKSIGAINTAVLLTSSLAVALAALAARDGRRRAVVVDLLISAALGLVFLGIKALEYYLDYSEGLMPGRGSKPFPITAPGAELFINAYWFATGIHALHVLIGVGILAVIAQRVGGAGLPLPQRDIVVEVAGLYWHFVDIVWIFLFPVLYLVGG
jgi:cytochrome c oxidase subunit III